MRKAAGKQISFLAIVATALAVLLLSGCVHWKAGSPEPSSNRITLAQTNDATATIAAFRQQFAPDNHLGLYRVGLERRGNSLVLTGEVDRAEATTKTADFLRG